MPKLDSIIRYSRQIILPEIGPVGQEKLLQARVLIIGLGGLGSAASLYLASVGVGTLGIVDYDKIKLDNLNRQILYSQNNIGKLKVKIAQERLSGFNKNIKIVPYQLRVNAKNILNIIKDYDVIIDASDNFPTRYLLNDNCVVSGKPLVYGCVGGWQGQVITILPYQGPCYRCLFPHPPKLNSFINGQVGVIGVVAGIIGALQALEAIKYILNSGKLLTGQLLFFNGLDSSFRQVRVIKDRECKLCSKE